MLHSHSPTGEIASAKGQGLAVFSGKKMICYQRNYQLNVLVWAKMGWRENVSTLFC